MTNSLTESQITLDNLTTNELDRFEKVKVAFLIQQATIYGDRVAEIMTEALLDDLLRDPRIFHHIVTGQLNEIDPANTQLMRQITKEVVEQNEFAMRSIEFRDEARRRELAQEYLTSLKRAQRIAFERDGTLEEKTATYVADRLDAKFD